MKKLVIAGLATLMVSPLSAMAYEAGDMIVRAGATQVMPQDNYEPYLTNARWGLGEVKPSNDTQLGITFVYMVTNNVGVELLAATPFEHDIKLMGGVIGETKHLPPTVSVQYYMNNSTIVTPYVGVGLNYTFFFNEDLSTLGLNDTELQDSFGLAYQAGVDIALAGNFGLNLDVRKIDIDTEVDGTNVIDGYAVNIDPTVYSITAFYKF
mgnify:CR=1 FL=1